MNSNRTLYGILAFAPLVLIIIGIIPIVISLIEDSQARNPPALAIIGICLLLLGGLMTLVGMIVFLVHASKNKALDDGERIGWIVGMIMSFLILTGFATCILTIIYFFIHIANRKTPLANTSVGWDSKSTY